MLQVSLTVFLRGQHIQKKAANRGRLTPAPRHYALELDCFMETLMSVNGSGIVTLTPLDEIEETDHLLREKILLLLKVSFYSYWGALTFFSSSGSDILAYTIVYSNGYAEILPELRLRVLCFLIEL
ncbi:hypothetical protein CEXT_486791 [Caerostris extrusa]|uniref:Uncharacterized protein n=1 Tax=Caerostris extrusa TaxID=172846 RepID=A0AAV4PBB6_CAEEX|nr:hypothetical protein CEXT_486791 [Caerostris extrusa]